MDGEQVTPSSVSASILTSTDTPDGNLYILVNQSATALTESAIISGGGDFSDSLSVSTAGTQAPFVATGLETDVTYYVHAVQDLGGGLYSNLPVKSFTTEEEATGGTVVSTPAQFTAAYNGGETLFKIPPGTYDDEGWTDVFNGKNNEANPITVQGQDPVNKPVFDGMSVIHLESSSWITFKYMRFQKHFNGVFFASVQSVNANSLGMNNCTWDYCEFVGILPSDITDTSKISGYNTTMPRCFRFMGVDCHSWKITNSYFYAIHYVGDFMTSGDYQFTDNVVEHWYYDGLRLLGCPDSTYVEGDAHIGRNDLMNCIGRYEEGPGTKEPHPDLIQMFNSADTAQWPNLRIRNLMLYKNRFVGGPYRGINQQAGLSECYMLNVGYVSEIRTPRGNSHGITLSQGGRGVLIERETMANSNLDAGGTALRLYLMSGQVMVRDTILDEYIMGDDIADPMPNKAGFELDIYNSPAGIDYSNFTGPGRTTTGDDHQAAVTPIVDYGRGAIAGDGQFRPVPHAPMMAKAPSLTAQGGGNVRIDTILTPTLMADDQVALGGTNYTSYDICWSTTGDGDDWTDIMDVEEGDILSGVSTGTVYFRTRCNLTVNAAKKEGLWSHTATKTVS